ncbi:hypothetical protein ACN20G_27050 (plasmid) [Streptomyces sp. BI20]|uniref:hypothetical protein n=1 Tax=Streptomyces sp. BI20 TaxID=3403460 RepID=UPI003C716FA9
MQPYPSRYVDAWDLDPYDLAAGDWEDPLDHVSPGHARGACPLCEPWTDVDDTTVRAARIREVHARRELLWLPEGPFADEQIG